MSNSQCVTAKVKLNHSTFRKLKIIIFYNVCKIIIIIKLLNYYLNIYSITCINVSLYSKGEIKVI